MLKKMEKLNLKFEKGNILIQTKTKHPFLEQFNWLNYDLRTQSYRCFGYYYKDLILALQKNLDYKDSIKAYQELSLKLIALPFLDTATKKKQFFKWSEQKRGFFTYSLGKVFFAILWKKSILLLLAYLLIQSTNKGIWEVV